MISMEAQDRYSRVARWLHWVIALCIIAGIALGLLHDPLEDVFPAAMSIHKSLGLTVLVLVLIRLGWRLGHTPPPLPQEMPGWEKSLAKITHALFYVLMLVMPLSGWIFTSAGKNPLNWFGLFDVPKFAVSKEDAITGITHEGHELLGFFLAGLVVLHIAAALRHHFLLKDNVLNRMLT
ncbi:cytochrome b [Rhizorhapis sp. SPR117]|uniref:cytochrome b n=1 Tax=Rhizorhapis sp. SPR117 TaxID=2912611 RepID=UPI001F403D6F|nr:cytochrome b [Rhizorhapis sp. SPR117]